MVFADQMGGSDGRLYLMDPALDIFLVFSLAVLQFPDLLDHRFVGFSQDFPVQPVLQPGSGAHHLGDQIPLVQFFQCVENLLKIFSSKMPPHQQPDCQHADPYHVDQKHRSSRSIQQ